MGEDPDHDGWQLIQQLEAWLPASRSLELGLLHRMSVTSPVRDRLNPIVLVVTVSSDGPAISRLGFLGVIVVPVSTRHTSRTS
jgi:hypothetical protein